METYRRVLLNLQPSSTEAEVTTMARLDNNWQVVLKDEELVRAAKKRARELELLRCINLKEIFKDVTACGTGSKSTKEKYNA